MTVGKATEICGASPVSSFKQSLENVLFCIILNISSKDFSSHSGYSLPSSALNLKEEVPHINDDIQLNKFDEKSFLRSGDIIIADISLHD